MTYPRVLDVPNPPELIRERLRGIRGLLLDLDGVMLLKGRLIPGAAEAMAELNRRRFAYQVVTNTSLMSRATLASQGDRLGLAIPAERITSALSATAAWTRRSFPGQPLFVITSRDGRREFDGQHLMTTAEADAPGAAAAAVVIGDSDDDLTHPNLNRAFRLVRNGARLIGMHRNPWWLTPAGPTLDSGAFVVGLEYATAQKALILGKPSRAFFVEAASDLTEEIVGASPSQGSGRIGRGALAMVGDDVWTDVLAGQRAGLRGVFVLTGKHGAAELERAAARGRGGGEPHVVAASLADVVAALD